ncbi:MAG: methyltransferase domain-containing protein [Proteobacteria bacterium]|nr:methyltransferase domain-containing protein [Pseudomonadota bacterium]MBU1594054.1 methyltransferase domain-containing protein [Pseudomonadota bacterium]
MLPCVALVRPEAFGDPALARFQGRALLPALLAGLGAAGLCAPIAAALPGGLDTPAAQELRAVLTQAGIEVFDGPEAPQARLARLLEARGWPGAVVISSYAALLDGPALALAAHAVATGQVQAAWAEGVGPERFFCALSRQAALALEALGGPPLPPTAFPAALSNLGLATLPLRGLETPAERFVTGARLAGEGRPLAPKLAALILDPDRPEAWFDPEAGREALRRHAGVAHWEALERVLAPLHENALERLAGQVRLLDALLPHLPERRGRFVELGAGSVPLCSALLSGLFAQGLALEPLAGDEASLVQTLALAHALRTAWPALLPDGCQEEGKLACEARRLEELALPDASVDLIFSRMTLEHVDDPAGLSREMERVLAPGGVMLHRVDFRDHTGAGEKLAIHFDFLRHSPGEWRSLGRDTNLLRVNDFLELWRGLGLCVEARERLCRRVPPPALHPCWSGYADEDLYCYNAVLLARRAQPANTGDAPCS